MEDQISVTLCTRQRPAMLESCLSSLLPQIDGTRHSIVVVENDTSRFCEPLLEKLKVQWPNVRIDYAHEPELGIPIARNRALEIALSLQPTWIAFIDDDEVVASDWLEAMLNAAATVPADALNGPVLYRSDRPLPKWQKRILARGRETGDKLEYCDTNNTLVKLAWLESQQPDFRFDEVTFRFTGGSDKDFFLRATRQGCRIRYVADAVVTEFVTPDRLTEDFHFRHAARVASNAVLRTRKYYGRIAAWRHLPSALFFRVISVAAHLVRKPWRARHFKARSDGLIAGLRYRPLEPYK